MDKIQIPFTELPEDVKLNTKSRNFLMKNPKKPRKPKLPPDATLRVQWVVYNHMGRQIEAFPYSRRRAAHDRATELREKTNQHHYVQKVKTGITSVH